MAKSSPMIRSFNAGEYSPLMEGRTDYDRYPASMRRLWNTVAAPQGPAIPRSGTAMMVPVADHEHQSVLVPFVFSNEQAQQLEFGNDRIRFVDDDGIQTYEPLPFTIIALSPFTIDWPDADAEEGDEIVLSGFPANYNLNGEILRIASKSVDTYELSIDFPDFTPVAATGARVYHVALPYTLDERKALRVVQSLDTMYLLTGTRTRKLLRYGTYDWRLEYVEWIDGPYMPINITNTTLTLSATGNALPAMTDNTTPSGTCSGSGNHPGLAEPGSSGDMDPVTNRRLYNALPESDFYKAFSDNDEEYWASDERQKGIIQYAPATPFVADGYVVYASRANEDVDYLAKDYAPSSWTFEGYDGANWTVLDEQTDFIAYENAKSVYFRLKNEVAYEAYRLVVTKLVRNGLIEARIRRLVISSEAARTINLEASAVTGINRDQGFKATDVNRLIRLKGNDNSWRSALITVFTDAQHVTVKLLDEPFLNTTVIKEWRLGYWSDTTGWPTTGDFFEDRLALAGSVEFPDLYALSVTGDYETFSQTDSVGVVSDDNAVVGRLSSRRLSPIRWLVADEKGLLIGTGAGEFILTSAQSSPQVITPRSLKARNSTSRGSANVEPAKIDRQVLYVQRTGRTLREMAYVFEADGYKSPSMSQLASHLGIKRFAEVRYAAEPHGIAWIRREDNSVVGLTYNRDENVIGWHQHDFNGEVESISVMPAKDQLQDTLWMIVKRTIDGNVRRYIERLTPFWDFGMAVEDAHYLDSALRYSGDPTRIIYGLQHLEGQIVYGLADNKPVGPFTVQNGSITLDYDASEVIIGIGYDSEGETQRLDNGQGEGTGIGKTGRVHNVSLLMWDSYGGEVGVWDEDYVADDGTRGRVKYSPVEYPQRGDVVEGVRLSNGEVGPFTVSPGYGKRNSISFRRPKSSPLPFNIVGIMPQMHRDDR